MPDLAESWSYNNDSTQLTFKLRQGVKWHDGKPFTSADVKCTWDALAGHARREDGDPPQEPAQALVLQPQGGEDQRRLRGDLRARPAAAVVPGDARRRLLAGLFLPRARARACAPSRSAPARSRWSSSSATNRSSWSRTRTTGRRASPYLDAIEWKIVPNRSTRLLGFQSGEFDMTFDSDVTFPLLKDVKAQQARRRLRGAADQRQLQPAGQSRQGAVQQSRHPQGDGAGARHQGLPRHPEPGPRSRRRGDAAAAGRLLGHAQGDAAVAARPFARPGEEPGRGAGADEEGGLRSRQAAQDQGRDPQHRDLSRSGGDPDRPAQADLHRGRARADRHHRLVHQDPARRLPGRHEPDRRRHRRSRT